MFELIGTIHSAKSQTLRVQSSLTQREYNISCPFFCPAQKYDVITGYCQLTPKGQLTLVAPPLVCPSTVSDHVRSHFQKALKGTGCGKILAQRLYSFLEEETRRRLTQENEKSPLHRNQSNLCSAVAELISMYADQERKDHNTAIIFQDLLTPTQSQKLLTWWYKHQNLRRLYLLGLTRKEIIECENQGWTTTTLYYQLIENPYQVEKISLERAQDLSRRYGLTFPEDYLKAATMVRQINKTMEDHGWACYPSLKLRERYPDIDTYLPILQSEYGCEMRKGYLYLRHQREVEDQLVKMFRCSSHPIVLSLDEDLQSELCEEQIEAVELALNQKVSIITGSAGTGKSTVISILTKVLDRMNLSYLVSAFTGKAVARLKELIPHHNKIMTLHMILMKGAPRLDYLIIDEISMVPNDLLARVGNKIGHPRLVLVGDPNQIPPIEWGDLFNQLLSSEQIPTCTLRMDHRTQTNLLHQNLRMVLNGQANKWQWGPQCQFIPGGRDQITGLLEQLRDHEAHEITIITPFNRDLEYLNEVCQKIFLTVDQGATGGSGTDAFGKTWRIGMRVMMNANRYDLNVMNGEEGTVVEVMPEEIKVQFHDEIVKIPTTNLLLEGEDDQPLTTQLLTISWAITIHKAQGSEWKTVIFYCPASQGQFCHRKLMYTGVSRAKENLYVVAPSQQEFLKHFMIDPPVRYDNLGMRLSEK